MRTQSMKICETYETSQCVPKFLLRQFGVTRKTIFSTVETLSAFVCSELRVRCKGTNLSRVQMTSIKVNRLLQDMRIWRLYLLQNTQEKKHAKDVWNLYNWTKFNNIIKLRSLFARINLEMYSNSLQRDEKMNEMRHYFFTFDILKRSSIFKKF